MEILYPSHSGRAIPVSQMADKHIQNALTSLRVQESYLLHIITGLDEAGAKAFKGEMKAWTPVITPHEMLERTRYWIKVLEDETTRRKENFWRGLH